MFANLSRLESFGGIEYFDTSDVKDMSYMFEKVCGEPWYFNSGNENEQPFIDLGTKFDTSNVENMTGMFYACGEGRGIRINLGQKFDTSKVTNMSHMFEYCGMNGESEIYWSEKFNTKNVRDMSYMFHFSFWRNQYIDLCDGFDTSNVVDMTSMFEYCGCLRMKELILGTNFKLDSLKKAGNMFNEFGATSDYPLCKIYLPTESVDKIFQCGGNVSSKVVFCDAK
jgi:hypothetical protein